MNKIENGECDITGTTLKPNEKKPENDTIKSGIYKIINKISGKYYVGSSKDVKKRWCEHKTKLNKNCHVNDYLQNSWNKHGKEKFNFVIVESVSPNQLTTVEQKYLDIAKRERNKCYNLTFDVTLPSSCLTSYSKHKISLRSKRLWEDRTFRNKMMNVFRRPKSENHKKNIGISNTGKKLTMKCKEKIRKSLLGRKHSSEHKQKISASLIGNTRRKDSVTQLILIP
jgi:group I intron endonuclease